MRVILKFRWIVLAAWVAALAVLLLTSPNMEKLVRNNGQPKVPDGYSSTNASHILKKMHEQDGNKNTDGTALVFYDKKGLSKQEIKAAKKAINQLKQHQKQLGIESVTDSFDQPDLKNKLLSKDGTTLLADVEIHLGDKTSKQEKEQLYQALKNIKVDHYFTGNWLIQEDYMNSTQEGLHQTEWITIVFILVVLLLVFRSIVTPLIPLITVGITFAASQAIVAFLVKGFGFPISNFTQIFLVAILFGIGTDYCILLLNRFKEELPKHESVTDAVVSTYKNGGRTMFFSGIAVLVGFSTIGLSTFSLYQSAVGVAIGVAVLIIALVTIVPILMQLLGRHLFWPARSSLGHHESRLWGAIGRFALLRPIISLLIVAAVVLPFILSYHGKLNFNSLEEIGVSYKSVKGFHILSDAIGPGEAMPTTIAIQNDEPMDQKKELETIEAITRSVKKVDHVKTVRSVTEPTGKPIKNFLVSNQAKSLGKGLSNANVGIGKVRDGLSKAKAQLAGAQPDLKKAVKGFDPLISGTKNLKSGVGQLQGGLKKVENGLVSSEASAGDLANGLTQAKQGAAKLVDESQQLQNGYEKMANGLGQLQNHYQQIQSSVQKMSETLGNVEAKLKQLGADHPEITQDPNYQYAVGATKQLQDSANQLDQNLGQLNQNLQSIIDQMSKANQGFAQLVDAQKQFTQKLQKAENGMNQLQQGLNKLANGQQQAINQIPNISSGLGQLQSGQTQLKNGFSKLIDQLSQLSGGLGKSVEGLKKVSGGISNVHDFLNGMAKNHSVLAGYYIPDKALKSKDFKNSMNNYMSKDRKITKINVIFNVNPYSTQAINQIDNLQSAVKRAVKGTSLENAKIGIGGATSTYHDLRGISNSDYTRTVLLMLIGIGLILIAFLRSFIMPIYVLISLVVSYFTAMGITEFIYVHILGYSGLNWAVPFFGFVLLVALGVDYSIFLLDRFNEFRHLPVSEAILTAMKHMGTVILSAAVILGGTFAAMIPSGVMALVEMATIVISGLVLYNLFMLPLFIPVMVKLFGRANWWPFSSMDDKRVVKKDNKMNI